MKVIDLLNKIANKEELPKIVKYDNYLLVYDEDTQDYYNEPNCTYSLLNDIHYKLNDEVEIIEDTPKDKRIEKLKVYENMIDWCCNGRAITDTEKDIIDKLNEIIDKINGE